MARDIVVFLRGGRYHLAKPLTFVETDDIHDSGSNGFKIKWMAYPRETPIFTGGFQVDGWSLFDAGRNIYRTRVPLGLKARTLYVNGLRATRAQGWSGFLARTAVGYVVQPGSYDIATWKHPEDLEFASAGVWRFMRCGVLSVSDHIVTMEEPCWSAATMRGETGLPVLDYPWWIENALELVDHPREWYLDEHEGWLYYKPSPDQNLSTAETIIPIAEGLLRVAGDDGNMIHDLEFHGITFEYTTWSESGTGAGYVGIQAGFTWRQTSSPIWWNELTGPPGNNDNARLWSKAPATVVVRRARSVVVQDNVLAHLGNAGINVEYGSSGVQIIGNLLFDISSSGIQVGDNEAVAFQAPFTSDVLTRQTVVRNNLITQIGVEFPDCVGVWAGYVDSLVIDHNQIFNVPFNGISLGWGWGIFDPTFAGNNQITSNNVHHACMKLWDCGSIYVMSAQPGSSVRTNYVHDQPQDHAGGLIYLDLGARYFTIERNVVSNAPDYGFSLSNVGMFSGSTYALDMDNSVTGNFTDASFFADYSFSGNGLAGNQKDLTSWPAEAEEIIAGAGLEPAYSYLHQKLAAARLKTNAPTVTSVSASDFRAGQQGTFTLTGVNTTFEAAVTAIDPALGLTFHDIHVISPTTMTVGFTASRGARTQPYSIIVRTGVEEAVLLNGLTIHEP